MAMGRAAILTASVLVGLITTPTIQERPPLEQVLERVGRYVEEYERSFSAIVSREHYVQRMQQGGETQMRELRSELALVAVNDEAGRFVEWIVFRDVHEVDGRTLHRQKERLSRLFESPGAGDAAVLARRIAEESARFNLGNIERTINGPTVALMFLRAANQHRASFSLAEGGTIDGVPVAELRFRETALPRMVLTHDAAPVEGRAWVAPRTGRVLRTQFLLTSAGAEAAISVDYADDEKLGLLVPVRMTELYAHGRPGAGSGAIDPFDRLRGAPSKMLIDGRATYSGFRRFSVESKAIIR